MKTYNYNLPYNEHKKFSIISQGLGYLVLIVFLLHFMRIVEFWPCLIAMAVIAIIKLVYDYIYLKKHSLQDRFWKNAGYSLIALIILVAVVVILSVRLSNGTA